MFLDRLEDNGLLAVSRGVGPELARLVALGRAALLASGVSHAGAPHGAGRQSPRHPQGRSAPWACCWCARRRFRRRSWRGASRRRANALRRGPRARRGAEPSCCARSRPAAAWSELSGPRQLQRADRRPAVLLQPAAPRDAGPGAPAAAPPASPRFWWWTCCMRGLAAGRAVHRAAPLRSREPRSRRGDLPLLAFFAAIGAGFMLIEISMLQRLIVFLGHPIYSLSVILFVLLLAGGIGARLSARVAAERLRTTGVALLAAADGGRRRRRGGDRAAHRRIPERRNAVAHRGCRPACSAVMGIFMGMAFPLGMRLASTVRARAHALALGGERRDLGGRLGARGGGRHGVGHLQRFWAGVASYLVGRRRIYPCGADDCREVRTSS